MEPIPADFGVRCWVCSGLAAGLSQNTTIHTRILTNGQYGAFIEPQLRFEPSTNCDVDLMNTCSYYSYYFSKLQLKIKKTIMYTTPPCVYFTVVDRKVVVLYGTTLPSSVETVLYTRMDHIRSQH